MTILSDLVLWHSVFSYVYMSVFSLLNKDEIAEHLLGNLPFSLIITLNIRYIDKFSCQQIYFYYMIFF